MISLKNIIVEGRYDSLVTRLSNILLRTIKDSYSATQSADGTFAGKRIYYSETDTVPPIDSDKQDHIYFEEVEAPNIPLEFYLNLKVQWISKFNDYRYGGDAFNDSVKDPAKADSPPLIEIRFELDPEEYPNILSEIAMDLRDVLRHEIEHITQSGWNVMQSKYLRSDMARRNKIQSGDIETYNYWLLQKEQPAMIQGLYSKAKKLKQPFALVVNSYLDIWVNNGTMSGTDKNTILKKWRSMLPKLGIRQDL
tara:strand:+ start:155 stop:910 length:756 start_codon:yes stop_codon:yes gene_type:complete